MIKITNLEKSFNGQKVLNGVNLSVAEKEIVAIMGKSGGGKSVLLKHIIGILKPDKGSVFLDGIDITTLRGRGLDKIREKFGVLFQGGALFDSLTVYQNIAFPLRERTKLSKSEIHERVIKALEDVGLKGAGRKYPAEISGGMRKRAALARALITEPKIVFFDEPTTGLDPVIVGSIHRLIIDAHKRYGFTGLIISHEIPGIFEVADRVALLHNGVIVEIGTPKEMQNSTNPIVKQFITGSHEGPLEL
jgi:phospholipid/cholesterol/gamma-HCH transport system ATP-binding protein